jgi:hypothetical protein
MAIDKKILSIDSDDDGIDAKTFSKYLQDDTLRQKNKIANDFTEIGEDLLAEIEAKRMKREQDKKKYIKYILRRSKKYINSQLSSYSLEDVKNIYDEIRNQRPLRKVVHFIFNL